MSGVSGVSVLGADEPAVVCRDLSRTFGTGTRAVVAVQGTSC
ncbi:hypothetical protein [Lapillicoccus sp.]|nr:hypothetical protein [Lapillicoccus sp.]